MEVRKEIAADRISGSDHTLCFNDHPDVPGIWKRLPICQRYQCYDYIVFYCDDAAYGAFVPDDTLTKRKDQVLGIPGLFCIHMCIKGG